MSKTVLFFPGQASQYVGMAKDLYESSEDVRRLYELAATEMNCDIARLSFEGPAEELKRTGNTQPAILLHSLSLLTLMGDDIPSFDYAAGHSLGEYGALAAAGAFTAEDAIKAVIVRARLMEEACQASPGTMAAVMGLTLEQAQEVCDKASAVGVVVPANINSAGQIVISGSIDGVTKAAELAKEAGAKRAMLLEVGGAFHSPLMESAKTGMQEYLSKVAIKDIEKPVIANVTAQPVTQAEEIRQLLVDQITSPVKWEETMRYLREHEVTRIVEIGPGKVLTGLARREMRPEQSVNIDRLEDIEALNPVKT